MSNFTSLWRWHRKTLLRLVSAGTRAGTLPPPLALAPPGPYLGSPPALVHLSATPQWLLLQHLGPGWGAPSAFSTSRMRPSQKRGQRDSPQEEEEEEREEEKKTQGEEGEGEEEKERGGGKGSLGSPALPCPFQEPSQAPGD